MLSQPVAWSFDLDDHGVVKQSIEQRRGDNRVAKNLANQTLLIGGWDQGLSPTWTGKV
jgi:hypothetical protein